ncbi:MAG: hypothetical protein QOD76_1138, partial [Solirubrobacteraceae bacterium]|nr:hypothetical protein [Solirubrobacteraceae bacterium]
MCDRRADVRTLVVSDLHLGARLQRGVLHHPEPLAALLRALDGVERLVLLGDVVELLEGRGPQAMEIAEPVLRALGARIGNSTEVILVPGNHDHALVAPWLQARGAHVEPAPLGLEEHPGIHASAGTEAIAQWLAPATLSVAYPGVWL